MFSKLMIPIAPMEKFSGKNFITCIEVSSMTRHSSNSNELRNVNTVRGRTGDVLIQNRKIYHDKIKVIKLIINLL